MRLTDSSIHVIDSPDLSSEARRLAEARSVRVLRVSVEGVSSKLALMERLSDGLSFPSYFGKNWDALYDCLTDLPLEDTHGFLLVIEDADQLQSLSSADLIAFLKVLRGAADYWRHEGAVFSVLLLGSRQLAEALQK